MADQSLDGSKSAESGESRFRKGSDSRSCCRPEPRPTTTPERGNRRRSAAHCGQIVRRDRSRAGKDRSRSDQPSCKNASPSAAMISFLRSNAIRIAPTSRRPGKSRLRNPPIRGDTLRPTSRSPDPQSGDFVVTRSSASCPAFDRHRSHSGTTHVRDLRVTVRNDLALPILRREAAPSGRIPLASASVRLRTSKAPARGTSGS